MTSAVSKDQTPSIKSLTIIRQDLLPQGGPAIQSSARQARFLQSVSVLVTPISTPDKFRLDWTDSQEFNYEIAMTDNPVENGAIITDHSRMLPDVIDITGGITDTTLFPPSPIQLNRAWNEWAKLISFFRTREPVFVATSLRVVPDMLIRRVRIGRTPDDGGTIPIQLTLREFRVARTATEIPLVAEGAAAAGFLPVESGGTQSPSPL
jgi:hypothetical protein